MRRISTWGLVTVYWAHFVNFFHSLAKADQFVAKAADQCYLPFIETLEQHPGGRITVNIDGSLTERLHNVGKDAVVEGLGRLAERGQVELTASGYGAAILPTLSDEEIRERIQKNTEVNRRFFGDVYRPVGFFPPEMSYAQNLAPMVRAMGYEWVLLDEMSHSGKPGTQRFDRLYSVAESEGLTVLFRERSLSMGMIYGSFEGAESFVEARRQRAKDAAYLFTATEVDIYNRRRAGPRAFFIDVLEKSPMEMVTVSRLREVIPAVEEISPVPASWSSWDTLAF